MTVASLYLLCIPSWTLRGVLVATYHTWTHRVLECRLYTSPSLGQKAKPTEPGRGGCAVPASTGRTRQGREVPPKWGAAHS